MRSGSCKEGTQRAHPPLAAALQNWLLGGRGAAGSSSAGGGAAAASPLERAAAAASAAVAAAGSAVAEAVGAGGVSGSGAPSPPKFLRGRDSVVWSRHYSWNEEDSKDCECGLLKETLGRLPGATRMVGGRLGSRPRVLPPPHAAVQGLVPHHGAW